MAKDWRLSQFDYPLDERLIAQTPIEPRDSSRMLHLDRRTGAIHHRQFCDLPEFLIPGDLVILNNTRVTARRLLGQKSTGGLVEALLLRQGDPPNRYLALMRPAKRLKTGAKIEFEHCRATVVEEALDGHRWLEFEEEPDLPEHILRSGEVPLPPYIHEKLANEERYQTCFNQVGGSAAAPTAALHFTEALLNKLRESGVTVGTVTLDVGIDTFRPVKTESVKEHVMHGETCYLSPELADTINSCKGRILAVGTTTVRTLETFAVKRRRVSHGVQHTKILLTPDSKIKIADGILTNFHLPRTTMLLMVAAFSGVEPLLTAYASAIENQYRFLSFGDSMLIV